MKYNDNGTYKDIYVKTFDTLPVGAEVDYDGETVPAGWTEISSPINAITVLLSSNQSANISSAYTRVKIAFDTLVSQVGDKLTFDSTNKCIVIGAGVNHIEVSVNVVMANGSNSTADRYVYIVKDKTPIENIGQAYYLNGIATNQHYPVNITPIICSVDENDKIIGQVSSGLVETLSVKGTGQPRTYLTVKAID